MSIRLKCWTCWFSEILPWHEFLVLLNSFSSVFKLQVELGHFWALVCLRFLSNIYSWFHRCRSSTCLRIRLVLRLNPFAQPWPTPRRSMWHSGIITQKTSYTNYVEHLSKQCQMDWTPKLRSFKYSMHFQFVIRSEKPWCETPTDRILLRIGLFRLIPLMLNKNVF